jgi:hypothetical protein
MLAAQAAVETQTRLARLTQAAVVVAHNPLLGLINLAQMAVLELSLFGMPILTTLLHQQPDHQQSRHLAVIAFTSGQPLAPLRFKESSWRTLQNLMKTMLLCRSLSFITTI